MPRHRPVVLVLAVVAALATTATAHAQWKWRDRSGIVQYSDKPPPSDIPAKDVLERPAAMPAERTAKAAADAPQAAASAAAAASAPAAAPAPTTVDPQLAARRKQAEEETAAKRRAEDEKLAGQRADNCQRARAQLRSLEDGMRLVRTNSQGEREVLDDKGRAEETARARSVIASECK
jgi:hypothetical protein